MYSFDGRIRYSETDPQGKLKIEALINYFQDCCSFQSEAGGVGLQYTKEHHIAWLVNFWQVEILRRPALGEYVRTTTIPYDFKAFLGYRNCVMEALPEVEAAADSSQTEHHTQRSGAGSARAALSSAPGTDSVSAVRNRESERSAVKRGLNDLAISNSVWSLIDLDKGLPVRIPPEMFAAYPLDPKIDMEYLPRKIALPKTPEAAEAAGMEVTQAEPVPVTASMIDANHHVNNGQYVRLALSFFPDESRIRRVCVEYVRQARQGDIIVPMIYAKTPSIQAFCTQGAAAPIICTQNASIRNASIQVMQGQEKSEKAGEETCQTYTIALCSQADRKPFAIVQVIEDEKDR